MKVVVQAAGSRAAVVRCQYLIAEVYNREYDVVFSDDHYDLDAKIEPWPHRYLMVMVDGELGATIGLYLRQTYVERFGQVRDEDLDPMLAAAGVSNRYAAARKREVTKLVVDSRWRGTGLGRFVLGAAHARSFLQAEDDDLQVVVTCAKRTIWENLYGRLGIRSRVVKPFPRYRVHERYCSPDDPMDSRLIIPELDVPPRWHQLGIPGEYEIERSGEWR